MRARRDGLLHVVLVRFRHVREYGAVGRVHDVELAADAASRHSAPISIFFGFARNARVASSSGKCSFVSIFLIPRFPE